MRDVLGDIDHWLEDGEPVALATVIQTWGSSPRAAGSRMAISASGQISGSVSGGCVEGAVVEVAADVLKSNRGKLLHFGVADETAWEVGLACGGSIDVFVNVIDPVFHNTVRDWITEGHPLGILTIVSGPAIGKEFALRQDGESVGSPTVDLQDMSIKAAQSSLDSGRSRRVSLADGVEAYVDVIMPPDVLIVVGGGHVSVALVTLARVLGYRTIVVDPRKAFANQARFPHADQIIALWPDKALMQLGLTPSTAVAVLTHDPKIDDPALIASLPSPAFYVGALGSQTTQARRRQRLIEAGVSEEYLERLHGPIGMNIGARTPEEVALAIMAEIVAAHGNKSLQNLSVRTRANLAT